MAYSTYKKLDSRSAADVRQRHWVQQVSGCEFSCSISHCSQWSFFSCVIGLGSDATASHAYADDVAMSPCLNPHGTTRVCFCGTKSLLHHHSALLKLSHSTTVTTSLQLELPHVAVTAHSPQTCAGWSERHTNRRCINILQVPTFPLRFE